MAKQIIVTIKKGTGSATVATSGFKGKACLEATADLEAALGKTTADEKTREYGQRAEQEETHHVKAR